MAGGTIGVGSGHTALGRGIRLSAEAAARATSNGAEGPETRNLEPRSREGSRVIASAGSIGGRPPIDDRREED